MRNKYLTPILAGILIGTSYIPFPPWAIFFAYVPLWIFWQNAKSYKEIFISGWLTQFVLTAIGFYWIAHTVHEFGHLSIPASLAVLALYCSVANLQIPIAGLIWFKFFRGQSLALPFLLSAGERLFPMLFDWHFGYTWLWARFPAFHLADTIGFLGLSTITFFINFLILLSVQNFIKGSRYLKPLALAMGVFLAFNVLGYWKSLNLETPDKSLKVLIVQSNVSNEDRHQGKRNQDLRRSLINEFMTLTSAGLKLGLPDFAIWPEAAIQEVFSDPSMSYGFPQILAQFLKDNQLNLITGAFGRLEQTGQYTNSIFAFSSNGVWASEPVHKSILLAFGEYFPGAKWFPILKTWFPEVADFGRGSGPKLLQLNQLKIGAQICYEGLFDHFTRSLGNQGAQIIVNVTNDSWYDHYFQPRQHGWMTLARAIEIRRPLVRSTNTGISMVILADGKILEQSPLHQEWFHLYEIPYVENPKATIFMGWGFWIIPALLTLGLIVLFLRGRNRK